jgi:hypothetical protein
MTPIVSIFAEYYGPFRIRFFRHIVMSPVSLRRFAPIPAEEGEVEEIEGAVVIEVSSRAEVVGGVAVVVKPM